MKDITCLAKVSGLCLLLIMIFISCIAAGEDDGNGNTLSSSSVLGTWYSEDLTKENGDSIYLTFTPSNYMYKYNYTQNCKKKKMKVQKYGYTYDAGELKVYGLDGDTTNVREITVRFGKKILRFTFGDGTTLILNSVSQPYRIEELEAALN